MTQPGFRIATLWAWVTVGDHDEEGVCAMMTPSGPMPLIGADEVRLRELRPWAEMVASVSKRPVRLVRFDARTEVEVLPGTLA